MQRSSVLRWQGAPEAIAGPLILRLNRSRVGEDRVRLEAIVHNWLAAQRYTCPDVRATGTDQSVLGGVFTVMTAASRPAARSRDRADRRRRTIHRASKRTVAGAGDPG